MTGPGDDVPPRADADAERWASGPAIVLSLAVAFWLAFGWLAWAWVRGAWPWGAG